MENYDTNATDDDGSCVQPLAGCTDPAAENYNATATADDGSCIYQYHVASALGDEVVQNDSLTSIRGSVYN